MRHVGHHAGLPLGAGSLVRIQSPRPLKGAGGYGFASITSVAFTTAVTPSPSFRCRSSALRRVITASITPLNFVDRPSQVIARTEN